MIARKMIAASISGTLFALLLGLIVPNPFGDMRTDSISSYLFAASMAAWMYMMYSFPVILVYGGLTSIMSEKVGEFIAARTREPKAEWIVSAALHALFGLILLWHGLAASFLFFAVDFVLKRRRQQYRFLQAIESFAIPFVVWLICIGMVWVNDLFLR